MPLTAPRTPPAGPETVASAPTCSGHSVSDGKWLDELRAVGERGPGSGCVAPAPALAPFALGPWLGTYRGAVLEAPCWDRSCRATRPHTLDPWDPAPAGRVRRPGVTGATRGETSQPCLPLPEAWLKRRADQAEAANSRAPEGQLGPRCALPALRLLTTVHS